MRRIASKAIQPHQGKEGEAVDEGGKDLHPVVAVGLVAIGRPRRHMRRIEGQPQGGGVRQHVGRVCEQRQGACQPAAHHLGDHESHGEPEGPGQPTPGRVGGSVGMRSVVVMAVHRRVLVHSGRAYHRHRPFRCACYKRQTSTTGHGEVAHDRSPAGKHGI